MSNFYYGGGDCSIEAPNVRGVEIRFQGIVKIIDKTPDSFRIIAGKNKIVVFPIGTGTLSDLFQYRGNFKVVSIKAVDNNGDIITANITKVMDYSELLGVSETITRNSEDLRVGYNTGKMPNKTSSGNQIITNQHTDNYGTLYLENGDIYTGNIHIHLSGFVMTGSIHAEGSEDLYFKQLGSDTLIPTKGYKSKVIQQETTTTSTSTGRSGY